ncbi:hypothetical protein KXR94_04380 [Stutzerimonas stutzeri]
MFYLFDTTRPELADYLNGALRQHGVDSFVLSNGTSPEGLAMFSIVCAHPVESAQARHLLYTDRSFVNDLHPEFAAEVRSLRAEHASLIARMLTSRPVLLLSGLALVAALAGYVLGI